MTTRPAIRIRGARQNNLKGFDLDLPLGELHVVTGVSGSGKSSLAFDTVYSEGQRRYVETFSSYARQFLDRMDKPRVDAIDGIPPAIAIDQTNPVRTSRSTVGTMTELNDHLKLLFARAAVLYCRGCGAPVRRDTPSSILDALRAAGLDRVMVTFEVAVPEGSAPGEIVELLAGQGYTRVHREHPDRIEVIQDRFRLGDGGGARSGGHDRLGESARFGGQAGSGEQGGSGVSTHFGGQAGSGEQGSFGESAHFGGQAGSGEQGGSGVSAHFGRPVRSGEQGHSGQSAPANVSAHFDGRARSGDRAARSGGHAPNGEGTLSGEGRPPGDSARAGEQTPRPGHARAAEAIESALKAGRGRLTVYRLDAQRRARSPRRFSTALHCARCDVEYREPTPSTFSFNSPLGACQTCRGFGRTMGIDYGLVVPDESKTLREGAIRPWQSQSYRQCQRDLLRYARRRGVPLDRPWRELDAATREWVLEGEADFDEGRWYGVRRFFDWLETKSYRMHVRVLLSRYRTYRECPACRGARLKPEALLWRVGTRTEARRALGRTPAHRPPEATLDERAFASQPGLCIHDVMRLPLDRCRAFFDRLRLRAPLDEATGLLLAEIRARLGYLADVGLGYLTLDRQSRTLSGGEVQRINLTTALGTSLVNTLFVLDEPSIGLHARDVARVVSVLHKLRAAGNTLLVVEHDTQIMRAADRIIDMGPGPGEKGGEVVFHGTPRALLRSRRSLTAAWLRGERRIPPRVRTTSMPTMVPGPADSASGPATPGSRSVASSSKAAASSSRLTASASRPVVPSPTPAAASSKSATPVSTPASLERIEIRGAGAHNLAGIDADVPLHRFVCVAGVSGSGKSTLVVDVLYRAACKRLGRSTEAPGEHRAIHGLDALDDVVLVDQSPIGKTTRSNPASYVGALDAIRKLFASEPVAIERGYTAGTFSFNSGNGRCPGCGGNGFEHVEMQFLSDVYLRCPDCDGRRYRNEVLDVKIRPPGGDGANIHKAGGGSAARKLNGGAGDGIGNGKAGGHQSIADVLEMTVEDALDFFARDPGVVRALAPLSAVGLGYLRLGQPVPTLSGGEAQRLKLAKRLAARGGGHCLFVFDEPTTGLHLEDISRMLAAFDALLAAGHSVLVIEHHLDVIAAADWIIDLGPEGGNGGGRVVATGRPEAIARWRRSHTGTALRAHLAGQEPGTAPDVAGSTAAGTRTAATPGTGTPAAAMTSPPPTAPKPRTRGAWISIRNAREHNLRGTDVEIPRERFTVVTGVSGSGKSTVAFDILFAEGQRRYLESLNAYARQFVQPAARPDVDAIFGIPPSVAIEQRTSRGGHKSTVGTMTEIHHFLRLLFVKLGTQHCPGCGIPIEPQTLDAIAARVLKRHRGREVEVFAPLVVARKGYYTELARWAAKRGHATLRVDGAPLPTDAWPRLDRYREHDIDLPLGRIVVRPRHEGALRTLLEDALGHGAGRVRVAECDSKGKGGSEDKGGSKGKGGSEGKSGRDGKGGRDGGNGGDGETLYSTARACPGCGRSFDELDPRLFSWNSRHGWCPSCYGTGRELRGFGEDETGEEAHWSQSGDDEPARECRACAGRRLRPEALAVRYRSRSIADFGALDVGTARGVLARIRPRGREAAIARDVLVELVSRLDFLCEVGLGYLRLDRAAPTLSGGEAQRIRLAAQLGSNLRGVCYILDEPTIGLHARDNAMLLDTLRALRKKGNTVVVVEHDEETIRSAEHIIDLGPGAGVNGGRVVAHGPLRRILACPDSLTGRYLASPLAHPLQGVRSPERMRGTTAGAAASRSCDAGSRMAGEVSPAGKGRPPARSLRDFADAESQASEERVRSVRETSAGAPASRSCHAESPASEEQIRSVRETTAGVPASRSRHAEFPTSEERGCSMRGPGTQEPERRLSIRGACLNNLRDVDVDLPLERLVCVTGVSGSGKSSLVRGVLLANLAAALRSRGRGGRRRWTGCRELRGFEAVGRVLEVDQTPIGKTPRSCPATYVGIWDHVRRLFAGATEARIRGYGASRFSFNVAGGRCAACEGQGVQRIEMSFLPDVRVPCDACGGRRFTAETLEIRYLDMSIAEVLGASIEQALPRFEAHPRIHRALALLHDVGLGYLTLGQSSPTLSGGEAQRIKLVAELAKVDTDAVQGEGSTQGDSALQGDGSPRGNGSLQSDGSPRDDGSAQDGSSPRGDNSPQNGSSSQGGEPLRRGSASRRGRPPRHGGPRRGGGLPPRVGTLYVLDEPTIGLHMADVEKLIRVLHRLVDAGNTVVVVEHNLDVIAEADTVIDLGPEGGAGGGRVVAAGSPEEIAGARGSHTGGALARFLAGRR